MGKVLLAALCGGLAVGAAAQAPNAAWRELSTEHFRVYYTAPAEAWTRRVAADLEAVRGALVGIVGYDPGETIDVVVSNPVAQPNGMALPLLDRPRMVLWTAPPGPTSVIGNYRDWGELLLVHEGAHLVQMLRPSRNRFERLLEAVLPLGPIALEAPRWVIEGYATYVEGRLTASGRPYSNIRAAILRRWAQLGRLPTYVEVSSDRERWLGGSMAYLMGSAYIEWLVGRAGEDSLRHLWARMTAKEPRSFEEAFSGVYGEPPAALYDRFAAELTWKAIEVGRAREAALRPGELWQRLAWTTGAPALSPAGDRLAIVLHGRDRPPRLVVWSTGPNTAAEKRWQQRRADLLLRDPEDVPAVRAAPLPREPLYELPTTNGAEPTSPRWLREGEAILFGRFEPDADGFLHPDLFVWQPRSGRVRRVTHRADVRDADPAPGGAWAVAVRERDGASQLVRVELPSGAVVPLTEPSVEVVYATPRVGPGGERVAFAEHRRGAWRIVVRGLASGEETILGVAGATLVGDPAWSADGRSVFLTAGRGGFIDVVRCDADGGGPPQGVARTAGAAMAPAPTPDGSGLYFLALEAHGLDVRYVGLGGAPEAPEPEVAASLSPAVVPTSPEPARIVPGPVAPGRSYGLGRQEATPLLGGAYAPSVAVLEAGVRVGDVLGRLDTLAIGGFGNAGGVTGAALASAWRGSPVTLEAWLFATRQTPSQQPRTVAGLGTALDVERRGAAVGVSWDRHWPAARLALGVAAVADGVRPPGGRRLDRRSAVATLSYARRDSRGPWHVSSGVQAAWTSGATAGDGWRRRGLALNLGLGHADADAVVGWHRLSALGAAHPFDRIVLGGMPSSLLPGAAESGRVLDPALPAGVLVGEEYEGQSVTLSGGGEGELFFVRRRLWERGAPRGGWLRVGGVRWSIDLAPMPLVGLPGLLFELGAARVLDAPIEGATTWWLGLAWTPAPRGPARLGAGMNRSSLSGGRCDYRGCRD